jgi:hypothetical protein
MSKGTDRRFILFLPERKQSRATHASSSKQQQTAAAASIVTNSKRRKSCKEHVEPTPVQGGKDTTGGEDDGIKERRPLNGVLLPITRHTTRQHHPTPLAFVLPKHFETISRRCYVKCPFNYNAKAFLQQGKPQKNSGLKKC